jgi:hypothetical protein
MTANSSTSPEGSILTPNGWVTGKVEFAGQAISAIDGRTTAAGAKPKGPFVLPGFERFRAFTPSPTRPLRECQAELLTGAVVVLSRRASA